MTTFLLLIACGIVGGLLFFFLHIPGGAMLGAVVAVLAVKMLGHVETDTPHLFQLGAQIAIGVMVGNMMTGGTLLEIRAMAPLMFGSTALLVVAVPWGPGSSAARPGWTRAAPSWPPAPAACRPWWAWPPTWHQRPCRAGLPSGAPVHRPAAGAVPGLAAAPSAAAQLIPAIKKRPGKERPLPGRIATVLRQRRAAYHQNSAGTSPPLPYRMP